MEKLDVAGGSEIGDENGALASHAFEHALDVRHNRFIANNIKASLSDSL